MKKIVYVLAAVLAVLLILAAVLTINRTGGEAAPEQPSGSDTAAQTTGNDTSTEGTVNAGDSAGSDETVPSETDTPKDEDELPEVVVPDVEAPATDDQEPEETGRDNSSGEDGYEMPIV